MTSYTKRYPKLRFALITEDALEKLRPETKPTEPNPMEAKDMYETISNTVDIVLEQKIKKLKLDKLDQMIEAKVSEFHGRQREVQRSQRSDEMAKSWDSEESIYTVSDFTFKTPKLQTRRISTAVPKDVRTKRNVKKAPFTKNGECKATTNKMTNGNAKRNRRITADELQKQDSSLDIAANYFKELNHRSKHK